jgi:hypothetical protein
VSARTGHAVVWSETVLHMVSSASVLTLLPAMRGPALQHVGDEERDNEQPQQRCGGRRQGQRQEIRQNRRGQTYAHSPAARARDMPSLSSLLLPFAPTRASPRVLSLTVRCGCVGSIHAAAEEEKPKEVAPPPSPFDQLETIWAAETPDEQRKCVRSAALCSASPGAPAVFSTDRSID